MAFQKDLTKTQRTVLQVLWESRGATRRQLEDKLGVSRPTIDKAVKSLVAQRMITVGSTQARTGGRPAAVIRLRDRAWLTVGLDLELPNVEFVLTGVRGDILEEKAFELRENLNEPNAVLRRLVKEIHTWLDELKVPLARLGGIGIGLPGFFSHGGVSFVGRNLPRWREVHVREYLERELSLPVFILHDVHCMAQAEVEHCAWLDKVVLFVSVRPGLDNDLRIGASLCIDGKAYLGGHGNGGALFRAVVRGDEIAGQGEQRTIEVVSDHLVSSLVHIIPLTDPDWVVIHAGCLGDLETKIVERCQRKVKEMLQGEYVGFTEILHASLRESTGAQQAALAAIQSLL